MTQGGDEPIDLAVARGDLMNAEQDVRRLNDELSDACTRVKVAKAKVRRAERAIGRERR
jgi:hypothetical protein